MINGLGVLGWGVGGIEAEAAMLGQPVSMLVPQVVGFRLTGTLREGATATDLVLTVTQMLQEEGRRRQVRRVLRRRAWPACRWPTGPRSPTWPPNTARPAGCSRSTPRRSATSKLTGRPAGVDPAGRGVRQGPGDVPLGELAGGRVFRHARARPLDRRAQPGRPAAAAGPRAAARRQGVVPGRAQGADRGRARQEGVGGRRLPVLERFASEGGGTAVGVAEPGRRTKPRHARRRSRNGSVVIAAITSCTNTSNPSVMVAAGLLAKKAVERGLRDQAVGQGQPGARARRSSPTTSSDAGLDNVPRPASLQPGRLRLHDLHRQLGPALAARSPRRSTRTTWSPSPSLSGNRNFEGRINPEVRANYLASPPLVVAYALAGTMDIDLQTEPLGNDQQGRPVYLKDIWPSQREIQDTILKSVRSEMFQTQVRRGLRGRRALELAAGARGRPLRVGRDVDVRQEPALFPRHDGRSRPPVAPIVKARVLAVLGDSITTDHISPAGLDQEGQPGGPVPDRARRRAPPTSTPTAPGAATTR